MPEIVEAIKKKTALGITFNWPDVMDGQTRKFVAGVDFQCNVEKFRNYCHVRAKQSNRKCTTNRVGDDICAAFIAK